MLLAGQVHKTNERCCTHHSLNLLMSHHPLSPKNYAIGNDWWVGPRISVEGEDGIVCSYTFGGTQKLAYKDGCATFQGVPPYPGEGRYIAIDWNAMILVYNEKPSKFILERVDAKRRDIFVYVLLVAK
ncbi:hypothetical protein K503DRAFT_515135 [Rhizopogon vinicolor AM-OR11-026]|uniref:Uncharacterized protein n=1 Tax=Rhizopogon vinicolor AM-OR11-026 TaxID=1314800 RepID=A0A1B7MLS1_9AGAM|nr:hypothetical protein K503DRAFT_515135 [Rhizopogon vinicolor AM-OR11-026]